MLVEMSHAAPPLRIAKLEEIIAQEELERLDSVLFFEGVSLLYLIGEVEAADALIAKATSHKDFADIKSRMRLKRVPQDGRKEAPALAALREFTRESVIGKQPGAAERSTGRNKNPACLEDAARIATARGRFPDGRKGSYQRRPRLAARRIR